MIRPLGHKLQRFPGIVSHVAILSSLIMQTSGGRAHTGTKEQMNTHVAMPYQLPSLHEIPREPCSRRASCDVKRDAPATRPEEEAIPSRTRAHLRAMRWYLMRTAQAATLAHRAHIINHCIRCHPCDGISMPCVGFGPTTIVGRPTVMPTAAHSSSNTYPRSRAVAAG